MSYFEDYVEEGLCCECCGEFLGGDEPGFVRRCAGCQPKPERERNALPRFSRYAIKGNPKVQQPGDPRRQGSKMSCPFCVAKVKVAGFGDHMLVQHADKWPASADTHPKGGDAKRAPAPLSGAVGNAETPNPSPGDQ